MSYELRLPDLGEGLTEAEIGRWLVAEGDTVAEDDPLVEVETDKTSVEIPSPAAGRVERILAAAGEVVPVGAVLVVIATGGGGPPARGAKGVAEAAQRAAAAAPAPPERAERVRATPRVRGIARELGVDLATVRPTGAHGEATESDVRGAVPVSETRTGPEETRVPLRGARRVAARHLQAAAAVPAVTFVEECDFTELAARRSELGFLPFVLQAVVAGLRAVPELNARLEGDELVLLDRYDLGLAVQTDRGLLVPVLRAADGLSLEQLAAESARLADAARAGTLAPEELRGSTFTVTSAGRLGGLFATPLLNVPEVGILGVHRIRPQAVVRDGGIHLREIGHLSVTFDHRAVDGARAAELALAVIARLERPD